MKKPVIELEEYFVLQDASVAKMNQNESPYDIPSALKKMISARLIHSQWNRYPFLKPDRLINGLSNYTNYPRSGIIVGNGSNEIIQSVLLSICKPPDKIVVVSPGYSIFPRLARIIGLKIVDVPLLDDFRFDVSSIIKKSKGARVTIFASPNNPTGTALGIEEIKDIANNIEGTLVIDEAYFEFYKKTALELLKKMYNIIIIRTFSKAFSLAGLRLGYLIARPEIAKAIGKTKLPFSVGFFQQIAGEVMLNNVKCIKNTADKVIKEREKLFSALRDIRSVKPVPSFANFILFEVQGIPARNVFEALYKQGVLLRYFEAPRLKNMLRVTVGRPHENAIFLRKLKSVLGSG
jgi:histidinol-phosphate aminotransferase